AGKQRSADAEADRIDRLAAGDFARDVEGGQHALLEIIVPGQVPELRRYVAPGDHEDRMALGDRVAHERILRLQVEDVVLVDARRHDQQRPPGNLARRRRVLDQLDQGVAVDDAARRYREVA